MRLAGGRTPGPGLLAPRLVGRDSELGQVRRWLAAAATGRGGMLVLQGDAGLGKTRLVQEIAGAAQARGIVMRAAEASEFEQSRPFGVICDALGVSPRSADPALAGLARRIEGQPAWAGPLEDVPVEVHNLVEALTGVFESLCTTDEVLLVIDNLHWADSSSLAVLRRLVRLGRQYPALIAATTRPTDQPPVVALVDAARQGGGAVLDLSPLDPESALALAGQLAGGPPGPRLAARVAQAAGNPLFVVELLTTLVQHGQLRVAETGLAEAASSAPSAPLAASILPRLSLLPAESVELLRAAAICGRTVNLTELSILTSQDTLALATSLRAASRAGIVETSGDTLSFRHELIHDALYQDWPLPVRRSLHRELGDRLAASGAPAWRVAHHLSLGAQPGDMAAAQWLHRAGLAAAPRDPAAAVSLLGRAAELAAAQASVRDVIRTDLSVALGWAGRTDDGERLAAAVMAETFDAGVRVRAASWLTSSLLLRGRPQQARDLCRRALASGVGSARAEILLRLVAEIASVALGDQPGTLDRMRQLLAAATELGDVAVRSACLQALSLAEANAGDLDAAAAHGAAAVRDTESVQTAEAFMANTHVLYAWILEEQDRLAEALDTVGRLASLAAANAESPVAAQIDRWRARAHFAAGHWDEAVVDLDSALRVYDAGLDLWPEPLALRALIAVHRGQLAAARSDLDRFDAAIAAGGSCLVLDQPVLARAFLLEAEGRTAQATAVLAAGWQIAAATPLALAQPTIGPHLARLAAQAGDLATAHLVSAALDALAAANPAVARLQAAARWAAGLARADAAIMLEAVTLALAAARPFDLALLREDAAAALARDGRPDVARELLGQAMACYEGLLARQRSAAVRARLRALGVQSGSTGRRGRPATGWRALTNSECQVVELVAEHLSNREIAQRLFVSCRTVETHVSHTLAKLGCTTRRDLIAAMRDRGRR